METHWKHSPSFSVLSSVRQPRTGLVHFDEVLMSKHLNETPPPRLSYQAAHLKSNLDRQLCSWRDVTCPIRKEMERKR